MDPTHATALRQLLERQPVAALATLHRGEPATSMVPFALLPGGRGFVIHVSRLATHTADMLAEPAVSLLVMGAPDSADTPLALPRASIRGRARPCPAADPDHAAARAAYLARLPDSEELFSFADFSLFVVEVLAVRYVAGFGRALSVPAQAFESLMK
jgi:heme iron utilization protein